MQVVLFLTVLTGFSYIGYGFGNYYVKRTRFLEDLVLFANTLKVQIGFSNITLGSIVKKSLNEYDSGFKQILKSYLKVLKKSDYVTIEELDKNLKTKIM